MFKKVSLFVAPNIRRRADSFDWCQGLFLRATEFYANTLLALVSGQARTFRLSRNRDDVRVWVPMFRAFAEASRIEAHIYSDGDNLRLTFRFYRSVGARGLCYMATAEFREASHEGRWLL
jgi:hypothetical protein